MGGTVHMNHIGLNRHRTKSKLKLQLDEIKKRNSHHAEFRNFGGQRLLGWLLPTFKSLPSKFWKSSWCEFFFSISSFFVVVFDSQVV